MQNRSTYGMHCNINWTLDSEAVRASSPNSIMSKMEKHEAESQPCWMQSQWFFFACSPKQHSRFLSFTQGTNTFVLTLMDQPLHVLQTVEATYCILSRSFACWQLQHFQKVKMHIFWKKEQKFCSLTRTHQSPGEASALQITDRCSIWIFPVQGWSALGKAKPCHFRHDTVSLRLNLTQYLQLNWCATVISSFRFTPICSIWNIFPHIFVS